MIVGLGLQLTSRALQDHEEFVVSCRAYSYRQIEYNDDDSRLPGTVLDLHSST